MHWQLKKFIFLLAGIALFSFLGCGGSTGPSSSHNPSPTIHNEWTWVSGSNTVNQPGNYGTEGVPAASNVPGGRVSAVSWIDGSGNFWLFGGYSFSDDQDLNDLWKYSGGEWTWMGGSNLPGQLGTYGTQGVAAPSNIPGARRAAASWMDAAGNVWLFGGFRVNQKSTGTGGGILNDLWKYNNSEWTWMSGSNVAADPGLAGAYQGTGVYGMKGVPAPTNLPGARYDANSWVDASGNFWLFGGEGVDSTGALGELNDLWKYSNGEWTWMSGSNIANQNGVYGTEGMAASGNVPGARANALTWTDASGNLWLFGGDGADAVNCHDSVPPCELNDLWKYSPATNIWTWMGGSNKNNQPGIYGTQGVAAAGNIPPPRDSAVGWMDAAGNFWLFGGNDGIVNLNDLWKYSNGEWTWVSGSNSPCGAGSYGIQGTPAPGNIPGARLGAVSWTDKAGNLWFFGGDDLCNGSGNYNDLWEYQP